jgi:nucleoside-diphosphate-sugar epimerase
LAGESFITSAISQSIRLPNTSVKYLCQTIHLHQHLPMMATVPPGRLLNDAEKAASPQVVVVTGCTGYLGSRLVQRLLMGGHTVHGTCRDAASSARARELKSFEGAAERLTLFEADLLVQDSFDAAMQGCDTVFHVASPISQNVKPADAPAVLFEPALEGTKNVLSSVNKCESVTRVVLTSSISAIYGKIPKKLKVYTKDDWNTECSASYLPYPHSKALAEKAAWEMAEAQTRWTMVSMCPSMIFGTYVTYVVKFT